MYSPANITGRLRVRGCELVDDLLAFACRAPAGFGTIMISRASAEVKEETYRFANPKASFKVRWLCVRFSFSSAISLSLKWRRIRSRRAIRFSPECDVIWLSFFSKFAQTVLQPSMTVSSAFRLACWSDERATSSRPLKLASPWELRIAWNASRSR